MVTYYSLETKDGFILDVSVFELDHPKGIVQIIHGALEYKERYFKFAEYLQENGYAVILSDNRGHGLSLDNKKVAGYMESYQDLIADQVEISHFIKEKYPDKPLYLLGHSFGSILARIYLQKHDEEIEKLVLTGTVNYMTGVKLGVKWSRLIAKLLGKENHSPVISKLTNDIEAKDNSWLSNNPENNEFAKRDPKMLSKYPVASNLTIWKSNFQLKEYKNYQVKNPQLEILSIVGAEDKKITGGSKGLKDTVATLNKIGYEKVESLLIAGMKHEILNEKKAEFVYDKILQFLNS